MMRVVLLIAPLALVLGGCESQTLKGSIAGGECKVFERPPYAVRGLRPYDQNWIDRQVEGGVGACGWKRPLPRPEAIDAVKPVAAAPLPAAKRRGVVARVKAAMQRRPAALPMPASAPAPAATVVPDPAPSPEVIPPAPQPPPRSRLDVLLDKAGPAIGR